MRNVVQSERRTCGGIPGGFPSRPVVVVVRLVLGTPELLPTGLASVFGECEAIGFRVGFSFSVLVALQVSHGGNLIAQLAVGLAVRAVLEPWLVVQCLTFRAFGCVSVPIGILRALLMPIAVHVALDSECPTQIAVPFPVALNEPWLVVVDLGPWNNGAARQ